MVESSSDSDEGFAGSEGEDMEEGEDPASL